MKKLFIFLALRNIFRNKRRTVLTLLVIISGVASYMIFRGYVEFTLWALRESSIRTEEIGHIQIYAKGYLKKGIAEPFEYLIDNYKELKRKLFQLGDVEEICYTLSFCGLISTGEKTLICKVFGLSKRKKSKKAFAPLIEGKDISEVGDDYCCVIGSELKKALKVNIGDIVTLLTTNVFGVIDAIDLQVVGICQSGSQEYDQVVVKIPLKIAQKILSTNSVEKIILYLHKTENTQKVINKLEMLIKKENLDIEYKNWEKLAVFYQQAKGYLQGILRVIEGIVLLLIFFSIANTQLMSVLERLREIATLRAIGTKKFQIAILFLTEGLWIGIIGSVLGIIIGVCVAELINFAGGIYIPPPPGRSQGYTAFIYFPSEIFPQILMEILIFNLIICLFSSLLPAIKGANLNIADGLRYV